MLSEPACRVNRSAINGRDAITRLTPEWGGLVCVSKRVLDVRDVWC